MTIPDLFLIFFPSCWLQMLGAAGVGFVGCLGRTLESRIKDEEEAWLLISYKYFIICKWDDLRNLAHFYLFICVLFQELLKN